MFINMNIGEDSETVLFEIFLGNQLIERQQVTAPRKMLEMMFINYMMEIRQVKEPMHLRMSGAVEIWDNFENRTKIIPKAIDCWNYDYNFEEET